MSIGDDQEGGAMVNGFARMVVVLQYVPLVTGTHERAFGVGAHL